MRGPVRVALLTAALLSTTVAACSDGSSEGSSTTTSTAAADGSAGGSATAGEGPADDGVVFPGDDWERADPEEMGFDAAALEAIAAEAEALDSACLVVTRKGRIVGEWYWDGTEPTTEREVFSATKSVTSTLVGMAEADGHLDIEDRASAYIDEWAGTGSDAVTVRNLLSNDSGRRWSFGLDYVELVRAADRTQFGIDLDQQHPPGEAWSYNNAAIQTLDRVISEATGQVTADYAEERLFEPIGMDRTSMSPGNPEGSATNVFFGMSSTCEDMARFGYLFLRDGSWDGQQVVPAAWVEEATGAPSQEHNAAYGYLWWLNREGPILSPMQAVAPSAAPPEVTVGQVAPGAPDDLFTAQGLGGQIVLVDPGSETVVVRLGDGPAGNPTAGFRAPHAARVVTEALVEP